MPSRTTTTVSATIATALTAFALTGCGGSPAPSTPAASTTTTAQTSSTTNSSTSSTTTSPASTTSTTTAAAPVTMTLTNYEFVVPASVPAGATIMITNTDNENHTVTSKDGGFDVKVAGHGGTATLTAPSKPGRYSLTCDLHGFMKGTLVVS